MHTARRLLLAPVLLAALLPLALIAPARAQDAVPVGSPCPGGLPTWAPATVSGGEVALGEQFVTMSDGTALAVDVTLPVGAGPFATVLSITGYGKSGVVDIAAGSFTEHGYADVSVDDRGTGTSGGQWDSWGTRTRADYPELIDWLVAQPWSDGSVALDGASYGGITSLFAAATGHPAVKAVFATIPMADAYRDITFAGGQVNAAFVPLWLGLVTSLGVVNALGNPASLVDHLLGLPAFQLPTLLQGATAGEAAFDGPFWRQRSPIEAVEDISAPTFIVGGLDDIFQRGEPLLYEALADHTDARLVLGPWAHITAGSGLPSGGVPSVETLRLQWFDHHVRGLDTGVECVPQVLQFVRGVDEWRAAPTWPVPDLSARRWHMRGNGGLTLSSPAAGEAGRDYLQLPLTGVCTRSANQWLIGLLTGSPCELDNRIDESIPGTLTYTSAPVDEELYVNGPIQADVWIRPSGSQALVSVALSDVAPDGTSRGLTNGLLTASHRAVDPSRARLLDGQSIQPWHPFGRADVLAVTPGEPILVPVEVFPTSAVLRPGHRLRVTIAAYDVPHALPPLPDALATLTGAAVTVLNDAAHPSSVVLPLVGAKPLPTVAEPHAPVAPDAAAAPEAADGEAEIAGEPTTPTVRTGVSGSTGGALATTGGSIATALAAAALMAALVLLRRAHAP